MIIRRRHTANFTTIGNVLFEDERLAADEVGILAYLLSRPHDWEVRRPALMRRWGMGREAIKRVITNWLRTGWAHAERTRAPNGTTYVVYEIRDEPGPALSEDEIRRALSLVSSEAAAVENKENSGPTDVPIGPEPPTGYPSLADPPPAKPYVVESIILNTELPRKDSNQISERETRARSELAKFLSAFEARWPTAVTDDRERTAKAAAALPEDERAPALAFIGPFLEKLKHDGRKTTPAGWRYLGQMPWKLAVAAEPPADALKKLPRDSDQAKAVEVLYRIANKASALTASFMRAQDGDLYYRREITPRLLALATEADWSKWVNATRQQAAAWNRLLEEFVTVQSWTRLVEGARVPASGGGWPPKVDGTWSATAPDIGCSEEELADFK